MSTSCFTSPLPLRTCEVQNFGQNWNSRRNATNGGTLRCSIRVPERRPRGLLGRSTGILRVLKAHLERLQKLQLHLSRAYEAVRPGSSPESAGLMANRYEDLPESIKGPAQMLGRLTPGCEGTHGVFPRCNFRCVPCYHGADANRVPISGEHTVVEVARQMAVLSSRRGPAAHAQLIGGEVSLLPAEDHARALEVMRFYGRIPMSFTHGDFDYDYLERLVLDSSGRRRFARVDFAAHFDRFMYGRRGPGARAPKSERVLHRHRARFTAMFSRLQRQHKVRSYLAHNMTVQPGNLDEVDDVVRTLLEQKWRLLSFQPAALQGARRTESVDPEEVWAQIEKGAGTRLPWKLWQMGHTSCNRVCLCAVVNDGRGSPKVVPFFDDRCERDTAFRDVIMENVGNIVLRPGMLYLKLLLVVLQRPWILWFVLMWVVRFARRGGIRLLRVHQVRLVTFVMHVFMDAQRVQSAWQLMQEGHRANSARVLAAGDVVAETVERLQACSYGMAHVDSGMIVPACVQHAVYDDEENAELVEQLGNLKQ